MCGIVAYVGKRPCAEMLLEGLKRLEYRGYDSAGIALLGPRGVRVRRVVGRVDELEKGLVPGVESVGLAHTRWATHGAVEQRNPHPQRSHDGRVLVVHNG